MIGRAKTEVAGAYWGAHGLIAVAGGFADDGLPTPDLLFYDVDSGEWTRGPDLPGNRDHAALAVLGNSLYLVGGFTKGLAEATADVWALSGPDGAWSKVASMGTARGALGATAVDGRIVAVGGVDERGRDLASTEWYDPDADTWTPGPELSRTRQHLGVSARGGTVYAIGGRSPNLATVEHIRFEGGAPVGRWRPSPSLQFSRSGNGAATADGRRVHRRRRRGRRHHRTDRVSTTWSVAPRRRPGCASPRPGRGRGRRRDPHHLGWPGAGLRVQPGPRGVPDARATP